MNNILWIIIFCVSFAGILIAVLLWLTGFLKSQVREDVRASQEQFLQLAKQMFESEQNKATMELETRKQAVESNVQSLKEELNRYQILMHQFEKDRDTKYGNLDEAIKNASKSTLSLQETTNRLTNILGNVKLRGQWGERMAEDIIRYAGLVENVNYVKQKQLQTSLTKPDFTFFLPDHHKINMDVKFPLDNYMNMINADDETTKDMYYRDFEKNVKDRIKEIQNREYINPSENTLDFVILFIPNEQVFGLINEKMPTLMDDALKQKVVLCSPFTLYAMLSVIRQAYENFRFEKDMKKIIQLMGQFSKLYENFKKRFNDIGDKIEKLEISYNDVRTKSFKQIDTKIRHIDDYKKGKGIALDNQSDEDQMDVASDTIDTDAVV